MKKVLSKIALAVLALLLVALIVWVIVANATKNKETPDREYNEEEVFAAARELLEESKILNEIYWGTGIPYTQDANLADGNYYPADDIYLEKVGIKTIEELENLTRDTFTDEMCDWIFETVLGSVNSDSGNVSLARYVQKWGGEDLDEPEYILVYKDADYWLTDTVEYADAMEVTDVDGERIYIKILVTVTNPDGKVMNNNITITLVEEEDGWRLDSPTYARYYEITE